MATAVPFLKRRAVRGIMAEGDERQNQKLRFFTVLWVGYMENKVLTEKSDENVCLKHL
tara:strand:- start:498 stop:671 length:174 start_codon:yes stop_codon:yes gene_type:complete